MALITHGERGCEVGVVNVEFGYVENCFCGIVFSSST